MNMYGVRAPFAMAASHLLLTAQSTTGIMVCEEGKHQEYRYRCSHMTGKLQEQLPS